MSRTIAPLTIKDSSDRLGRSLPPHHLITRTITRVDIAELSCGGEEIIQARAAATEWVHASRRRALHESQFDALAYSTYKDIGTC